MGWLRETKAIAPASVEIVKLLEVDKGTSGEHPVTAAKGVTAILPTDRLFPTVRIDEGV